MLSKQLAIMLRAVVVLAEDVLEDGHAFHAGFITRVVAVASVIGIGEMNVVMAVMVVMVVVMMMVVMVVMVVCVIAVMPVETSHDKTVFPTCACRRRCRRL